MVKTKIVIKVKVSKQSSKVANYPYFKYYKQVSDINLKIVVSGNDLERTAGRE